MPKTAKGAKGRYSDAEVMKLADEVKELEAKIAALSGKIGKRKSEIIAEMERRGTKAIEHSGRRITYVQSETVVYDEDAIFGILKPTELKKVTVRRLDKGLLLAAVQAGTIEGGVIAGCSTVRQNAPYYRYTQV